MREQTIVWRDDFESIEFREATDVQERTVSEEVIVCTQHGSKYVGLFCKGKNGFYFEANSGTRLTLDKIKEFSFLE